MTFHSLVLHHSCSSGTSLARECIGRDLVVIGAGSVAMDVATAALSLGCRSAYAVFLPSMTMMTADVEEIEVARKVCGSICGWSEGLLYVNRTCLMFYIFQSGVIFRPCTRMTAIQRVDNKVSSISVTEVEAVISWL